MAFVDPTLFPWTLTWAEADPARHPFDADGVLEVVPSLPPAAHVPTYPPQFVPNFFWDTAYPWSLLRTVRRADDRDGAIDLIRLVEVLITHTRRRSAQPRHAGIIVAR